MLSINIWDIINCPPKNICIRTALRESSTRLIGIMKIGVLDNLDFDMIWASWTVIKNNNGLSPKEVRVKWAFRSPNANAKYKLDLLTLIKLRQINITSTKSYGKIVAWIKEANTSIIAKVFILKSRKPVPNL